MSSKVTPIQQAIERIDSHKDPAPNVSKDMQEGYIWGLNVALQHLALLLPAEREFASECYKEGASDAFYENADGSFTDFFNKYNNEK